MFYQNDAIIVDANYFDAKAILECGQLFRYGKTQEGYFVISGDKRCLITPCEEGYKLNSDDIEYFNNYFDLDRDYAAIIERLKQLPYMQKPCEYGKGIRILSQQPYETLISFIISANNHIPRIKAIIERLCLTLGKKCNGYYAFPTAEAMASKDPDFYAKLGAGYRAAYLAKTARAVADGTVDLQSLYRLDTKAASATLKSLMGVGQKVADCILLFAYRKTDLFPVDTWVKKIYSDMFGNLPSDNIVRNKLIDIYKQDAGYAQQYLFYYKRETKLTL